MRSTKLTTAVAAAAALLALAAGPALARPHTHLVRRHGVHAGVCKLSLSVAPRLVTSGETALAYGRLACGGSAEAGQPVTLYERAAGSPGVTLAGTGATDAHGFYQITTPALTANSLFYAVSGATQSPHRPVRVAAQVTLNPAEGGKTELFTGRRNAVSFSGTVNPTDAGAEVVLQRQNAIRGTEWHMIGRTIVNSAGGFSITHVFFVPGASEIRVVVRSNHRNIASASNELSYVISQAQNPSLTINTSSDPIAPGGSVVISGVAAGAPGAALTLLGRPSHGAFVKVATTTSGGEGKYSFPAQTPKASTFYRVQGAGRNSAVLYQGVKYQITAAPAATTVQSGSPFVVSGTVNPAVAGHTIFLERHMPTGTGFHVVAVGSVGPEGKYTISRVFYAPGALDLRVKIPGDPEYGGAASEPFMVTITPLPTPLLRPEPQGNGSLPPEGQV